MNTRQDGKREVLLDAMNTSQFSFALADFTEFGEDATAEQVAQEIANEHGDFASAIAGLDIGRGGEIFIQVQRDGGGRYDSARVVYDSNGPRVEPS